MRERALCFGSVLASQLVRARHALATWRRGAEEEHASRARSRRADKVTGAIIVGHARTARGGRGLARSGRHVGEREVHGGSNGQAGSAGGGAVPLREIGHFAAEASGCGPRLEKEWLKRRYRELPRRVTGRDEQPRRARWVLRWEHASDGWYTTHREQSTMPNPTSTPCSYMRNTGAASSQLSLVRLKWRQ